VGVGGGGSMLAQAHGRAPPAVAATHPRFARIPERAAGAEQRRDGGPEAPSGAGWKNRHVLLASAGPQIWRFVNPVMLYAGTWAGSRRWCATRLHPGIPSVNQREGRKDVEAPGTRGVGKRKLGARDRGLL